MNSKRRRFSVHLNLCHLFVQLPTAIVHCNSPLKLFSNLLSNGRRFSKRESLSIENRFRLSNWSVRQRACSVCHTRCVLHILNCSSLMNHQPIISERDRLQRCFKLESLVSAISFYLKPFSVCKGSLLKSHTRWFRTVKLMLFFGYILSGWESQPKTYWKESAS